MQIRKQINFISYFRQGLFLRTFLKNLTRNYSQYTTIRESYIFISLLLGLKLATQTR